MESLMDYLTRAERMEMIGKKVLLANIRAKPEDLYGGAGDDAVAPRRLQLSDIHFTLRLATANGRTAAASLAPTFGTIPRLRLVARCAVAILKQMVL